MAAGRKTGGRKRGTPNKVDKPTLEMRQKLKDFCEYTFEEFVFAFHAIDEPKDKCKIWLEAMAYNVPKPAQIDLNVSDGNGSTFDKDMADLLREDE